MPKKLGKKSLSELGNETRHGKRLKGICAMQSDLKEVHGINLAALPRGDGSRRAALTTPGLATSSAQVPASPPEQLGPGPGVSQNTRPILPRSAA